MSAGIRHCSRGFLKGSSREGAGIHLLAQERKLAEWWELGGGVVLLVMDYN